MSVRKFMLTYMNVKTSTTPTMIGKSLLFMAWKASLPSPGIEKIVSVTTAPVINAVNRSEEKVRGAIF